MSLLSRRFAASFRGYQLLANSDQQHQQEKNVGSEMKRGGPKGAEKNAEPEEQNQKDDIDDDEVEELDLEGDGFRDVTDKSRLFDPKDDHHRNRRHQQTNGNNGNRCFLISLIIFTVFLFFLIVYSMLFSSPTLLPTRRPPILVSNLSVSTVNFSLSTSTSTSTVTSPPAPSSPTTTTEETVSSTLLFDARTTTVTTKTSVSNSDNQSTLVNNSSSIYDRFIVYTPTCKIPSIPVFTSETRPLYQKYKYKEFKCSKDDGTSAIRRVNFTAVSVPVENCSATYILRDAAKESAKFGQTVAFNSRKLVDFPDADAVKVVCPGFANGATKILPLIPVKAPIWKQKTEQQSKNNGTKTEQSEPDLSTRPNILAIGIDSISRLNYLRHFTEMQAFLQKEGNFDGPLYGLQKIGDNTFPNLIGMFTGRTSNNITSSLPPSKKLDNVPLIFKKFSAAGYLTTYIENMPNWGLWTYHQKNGFGKQQPLEYLMRPVNILVYRDMKNSYCYKDRLEMELYYDYLLDQMRAFRERKNRFLTFIHMGAISHDHLNYAQYADGPMTRFMKRIFADQLHNDTLIIFYSDHGIRFGSIVQTDSGFQESRMPFMFFRVPKMMRLKDEQGQWQNSSQLREIFQLNARRLTSQFDVHATLRHLLTEEPPKDEQFGHSLFSPIPLDRTCEQAGIPDEYCTCSPFTELKDPQILALLTTHMITYLNGRLAAFRDKCADLSLDRVLKAKMSAELPPKNLDKSKNLTNNSDAGSRRRFFMRIRLQPSKGSVEMILQGMLRADNRSSTANGSSGVLDPASLSVVSGIIRLDRYNEQSRCVANTRVESFCYCRSLLVKNKGNSSVGR